MASLNYSLALKAGYPQCNGLEQTWVYVVTKIGNTSGAEISHLEVELCDEDTHNVLRVSKNGVEVPVEDMEDLAIEIGAPNGNCLVFNPPDLVRRIKWDNLSEEDLPYTNEEEQIYGEFNFVLEGCFETDTIAASIKGGSEESGGGCDIREIDGPSCTPIPPPHRGIKLSQFEE